ncbi:MAG: flagellar biosynthetic protein FliQ [Actinomycetota bacterium]
MTDAQVLEIVTGALRIAMILAGPTLVVTLGAGVVISLIQTVTQIQEQTLTFVPKLIGVGLIAVLLGSWMIRETVNWVTQLWSQIPSMV